MSIRKKAPPAHSILHLFSIQVLYIPAISSSTSYLEGKRTHSTFTNSDFLNFLLSIFFSFCSPSSGNTASSPFREPPLSNPTLRLQGWVHAYGLANQTTAFSSYPIQANQRLPWVFWWRRTNREAVFLWSCRFQKIAIFATVNRAFLRGQPAQRRAKRRDNEIVF